MQEIVEGKFHPEYCKKSILIYLFSNWCVMCGLQSEFNYRRMLVRQEVIVKQLFRLSRLELLDIINIGKSLSIELTITSSESAWYQRSASTGGLISN